MTVLEVCLDDIAGAILAENCGVDRIELCSGLSDGGTTPSIGTVQTVLDKVERIGVQVLVRQRAGDFVYSPAEVEAMCADIDAIAALTVPPGVQVGFVIGALTPRGMIDREVVGKMLLACGDAPVTFHKAFDETPDLSLSLDSLIELGVQRVLTSGGPRAATEGAEVLASLVQQAAGRIGILAAGGIRPNNVAGIITRSGVSEVHLRAAAPVASASLTTSGTYDSGSRMATSAAIIDDMLSAMRASESRR